MMYVIMKGANNNVYGLKSVAHIELMYGLYSNHELNDEKVYDDDWIVHHTNA